MLRERVLPYLWYPLAVAGTVLLFGALLHAEVTLPIALYVPIVLAALATIVLQRFTPERIEWQPRWQDLRTDASFLVLVQVALPRVLVVLAALALADWAHATMPSAGWPHGAPLVLQTLLMVLAVDLARYWLHRACHHFPFLWRLHEVHHAPERLYSLNVGRFHPFEKALHFSLDTLPFLALGVDPRVIAGYFLLYAVNGFFQHSNVRLRYGWLNYVVGSAETHRWHHARDPNIANCNFSNTTILWDLVFGTFYLPPSKGVGELGIPDKAYPEDFWRQLLAPFRRHPLASPGRSLSARLIDAAMKAHLRLMWRLRSRRLIAMTRDPMRAQRALLAGILGDNRDTTFGRDHGFAAIDGYEAFARRVPPADFEALRPYVQAEVDSAEKALTDEPPARYVRTSGTTGQPKDVPLTASHLASLRRIHQTSVACQHHVCPEAFDGSILAIISPGIEGRLANGKPFGAASGIVAESTPALLRDKFVLPAPVLGVADSRLKYLLILRLAVVRADLSYLGTANATTLLQLMKLYRAHAATLIEDVRTGGFFLSDELDPAVRSAVEGRLRANPTRAAELRRLQHSTHPVRIADLWPSLRLVVTWTCASAGVAVAALRQELSSRVRILELGYVASEFRATITLGRRADMGLPTLDTHFFEFVERDAWDRGAPVFLTLDRVRKGRDYYVLVTTPSGLYRYFINDLVRVTGFLNRTPLLKFLQKGKGVTSITGEKLYECQVLSAVGAVLTDAGCAATFVMMLADEAERRYRLYVECETAPPRDAAWLARRVDDTLMQTNIEYHGKRESGRLDTLAAAWLEPGALQAYKAFAIGQGQREGQFKTVALAYRKDFRFALEPYIQEATS